VAQQAARAGKGTARVGAGTRHEKCHIVSPNATLKEDAAQQAARQQVVAQQAAGAEKTACVGAFVTASWQGLRCKPKRNPASNQAAAAQVVRRTGRVPHTS
jgi:hypothetical protein